jgi:hypothetical protein
MLLRWGGVCAPEWSGVVDQKLVVQTQGGFQQGVLTNSRRHKLIDNYTEVWNIRIKIHK